MRFDFIYSASTGPSDQISIIDTRRVRAIATNHYDTISGNVFCLRMAADTALPSAAKRRQSATAN